MFYWIRCGDIDLFDTIILSELLAVGAVYALMALLAAILHEDLLAANPFTVLGAIRPVGWSYAQPCLLTGSRSCLRRRCWWRLSRWGTPRHRRSCSGCSGSSRFTRRWWCFRVLGLFYHRHARVLGWFRGRTRWGV